MRGQVKKVLDIGRSSTPAIALALNKTGATHRHDVSNWLAVGQSIYEK